MKEFYVEAMAVYMRELEDNAAVRNDAYYKASNAMHRGDVVNYNKWCDKVKECNTQQINLIRELNVIKAAYAAI